MFEKPLGGTELMFNELMRRIPEDKLSGISLFNYPGQADPTKKLVYWNQLSYDQDAVQFLREKQNVDRIDHFVFVSHWQAEQFRKFFNIPGEKTHVIKNASIGVSVKKNYPVRNKIKLCYTSTPWRGLDVLLKAWEILNPQDCELHIFSSCKIYGKDFSSEDQKYEFLYDWAKRLPNVHYRGSIPNENLRQELEDFDFLAYPNTFEETSCIAVIEAISAGLRVIVPAIGALPETCEGWARMYSYIEDREKHAVRFSEILNEELELFRSGKLQDELVKQSEIYNPKWNWDSRIKEWEQFLNSVSGNNYSIVSKYLTPNSILDIGANIGQFYNKISKVFPNSKYHLIEANPSCEDDLKKLGVDYTISLLSDSQKRVNFWVSTKDNRSTGNSYYKEQTSFFNDALSVEKEANTLDNLFTNKNFDLIKLDTQGSEIDIIRGGLNLVKVAKAIIIEVSHIEYNQGSPLSGDVQNFLESIGFEKTEVLDKIYHPETGQHIQDEILYINKNLING